MIQLISDPHNHQDQAVTKCNTKMQIENIIDDENRIWDNDWNVITFPRREKRTQFSSTSSKSKTTQINNSTLVFKNVFTHLQINNNQYEI